MKRAILFRGKRVDNGEWLYGDLARSTSSFEGKEHNHVLIGTDWDYEEVIPETVGQFTGLMDKNGNKIFEGDILNTKTSVDDNWADRRFQDKTLVTVVFSEGSFRRDENAELLSRAIWCIVHNRVDYIITGNIHDNPTT